MGRLAQPLLVLYILVFVGLGGCKGVAALSTAPSSEGAAILQSSLRRDGAFGLLRREKAPPASVADDDLPSNFAGSRNFEGRSLNRDDQPPLLNFTNASGIDLDPGADGLGGELARSIEQWTWNHIFAPNFTTDGSWLPPEDMDPAFAKQMQLFAGVGGNVMRLPPQPTCSLHITPDMGESLYGNDEALPCRACQEGCTDRNMQVPLETDWSFFPSMHDNNAFDLVAMIEFIRIEQLKPYSLNGVRYELNFALLQPAGGGEGCKPGDEGGIATWRGHVGPQVAGGVPHISALNGRHRLEIRDTAWPNPDGSYVRGRWLVFPSSRSDGVVGNCRRECIGCDTYPQLLASGLSTGIACTIDLGIKNEMAFVYRVRLSKDRAEVWYDGNTYMGSEWQVDVHDTTNGEYYILARVVLEGTSSKIGISSVYGTYRHLGCSPCDAYYAAVRVTGPFVLRPKKIMTIEEAEFVPLEPPKSNGSYCKRHRVSGLGGYSLLYESGPGVQSPILQSRKLFSCPVLKPTPCDDNDTAKH